MFPRHISIAAGIRALVYSSVRIRKWYVLKAKLEDILAF